MIIEVTQKDIDEGCRLNGDYCPVAIAINRHLNQGTWAKVSQFTITIVKLVRDGFMLTESLVHTFVTPQVVQTFVAMFDKCVPVMPFKFELDLSLIGVRLDY